MLLLKFEHHKYFESLPEMVSPLSMGQKSTHMFIFFFLKMDEYFPQITTRGEGGSTYVCG